MKAKSVLFFCCLACCGALFASTNVSGIISNSQTWTLMGSSYIITGNV